MFIRLLSRILQESLFVVSEVGSNRAVESAGQLIFNLNNTITEFNAVLSDYRVHEAREIVCNELEAQLLQMKDLERVMERYFVISSSILAGVICCCFSILERFQKTVN